MYKIQMLKNLLLILSLFFSSEFFLQENNQKDTTINNQKLIGTNVDFEFIDNLDFPKFIEVEKDTFNDKVISLDTTKKISFSKEQVDLGIKFEEIPYEKKILFPEEPIPVKSSQFSELKINNKIIEELHIKKELSLTYFKILIDNDKNIWIIGMEKIIRFDGSYFHIYNLIENFGFENINPSTADIDFKGNIWFGTKNQILKFDGSKLTCLNNIYEAELKNLNFNPGSYDSHFYTRIEKIFCFKNDVFFTLNGKKSIKNILKYSNDKLFILKADSSQFLSNKTKLKNIDNDGEILIVNNEPLKSLIYIISKDKIYKYIFKENERNFNLKIFDSYFDSHNNLWLSNKDGIFKIKDKHVSFYSFSNIKNKIPFFNTYYTTTFIKNDRNKVLIECQNGIYEYNSLKDEFNFYSNLDFEDYQNINFISFNDNNIWLSCKSKIFKIKDFDIKNINKINNNKSLQESNFGGNISLSFITLNEEIWSLMDGKGIVKISENHVSILNDNHYKTSKNIKKTRFNLFLNNGIGKNILHGFESYLPYDPNSHGYSSTIMVLNLNTINNKYSVLEFNLPKEFKNKHIYSAFEDSKNRYWIAATNGLYKYSNKSLIFYSSEKNFKSKAVINIYEDQSKNIWLLHENSLTKIHDDRLTYFGSNEGLNTKNINSFTEFEIGNYWVSTTNGLFKFDGNNFTNYSLKEGLKSNFVSFFIKDNNGRKIICSQNSLDELKFIGDRIETHNIVNYNISNYIGSNKYSLSKNNILFLKNDINQFMKINLNELDKLNRSLKITLDKVYINDKLIDFKNLQEFRNSDTINYSVNDIELDQIKFTDINSRYNYPINLKLPYYYNHITFFFDGIKWENQSNISYEYKIDKLDKKWRSSTETRAEYRNLPPGKHKFMIRGKSSFSEWSEPFIYEFTITPPWWKTLYARLAYIIIGILLVWRVIKYRTQSLEKKQKELELEIAKATDEIQTAYVTLEEQHNEIKDSIKYAKRIQNAILPNVELMKENFKDCYVLYMPKDVVAGDFFWMEKIEDSIYFAAADCTGHGVPGAMISVICSNALSKALLEDGIRSTGKLLDKTRELVIQNLAKSGEEVKDGMDISLCCLNLKTRVLYSSGANNPVLILRKESSDFDIIKADRQPVGLFSHAKPFKEHKTQLEKGDKVYIFTDGYQDQFGGEKGKKLMPKKFKKLLLDSNQLSMDKQKENLENEFNSWKGELEQIDDVCVIGVEI